MRQTRLREMTRLVGKIPQHLHEVWLTMTTGDKVAITSLAVVICGSLLTVGIKVGNVETKQDVMAADVAEIKGTLNEIAPRKVKTAASDADPPPPVTIPDLPNGPILTAAKR